MLKNPISDAVHEAACHYRLERVRQQLDAANCDAILLYDPVNIRYATEAANMQVWTLHNYARYVVVIAGGPVILWEFQHCAHLHADNRQLDEQRVAVNWSFLGAGGRAGEKAVEWAGEIVAELRQYAGATPKLAVDTAGHSGLELLKNMGVVLCDGQSIMEQARVLKNPDEIELIRWTIRVCEAGMARMFDELVPGISEQELWSWLHHENIRNGGEWIETRLLSSGPRTNPWMQEASSRRMQEGELVCFDTDLIGPYGYCADISRAWTVGHTSPTAPQRELYRHAYEQVCNNAELLKPGVSFREISERAWPIPERYYANRYCFLMHGVGMIDEYPAIAHWGEDWESVGNDGVLEENMVISVESYIGEEQGMEGVKLENQFVIGANGAVSLCEYPWNDSWL